MIKGYNVYHAPDGCDPEFIGWVPDLEEAQSFVGLSGLPKSLWGVARAAGHCGGMYAPEGEEDDDNITWLEGDDGCYCAVAIIK
jgi:hypothetical protein